MHALFPKTKCTPIFSVFVAHCDTLNNSVISLCLKIRVRDNSHSKLYNNVRFAVHTLYMMHPMLNYSHSNPADTHLKKQLVK